MLAKVIHLKARAGYSVKAIAFYITENRPQKDAPELYSADPTAVADYIAREGVSEAGSFNLDGLIQETLKTARWSSRRWIMLPGLGKCISPMRPLSLCAYMNFQVRYCVAAAMDGIVTATIIAIDSHTMRAMSPGPPRDRVQRRGFHDGLINKTPHRIRVEVEP